MKKSPKLFYGFGVNEKEFLEAQTKPSTVEFISATPKELTTPLSKSIMNSLNSGNEIVRLAFEVEPSNANNTGGIWRQKLRGVPDIILKRIAVQDSLVACIVRQRQNHVSTFGRPRVDRHSFGYTIDPNTGLLDTLDQKGRLDLNEQIKRAVARFATCGSTENLADEHQKTFSEYLSLIVRSGLVNGRFATEILQTTDPSTSKKSFHHFAAVDAGTIYPATTDWTGQEAVREEALRVLSRLAGEELTPENKEYRKYTWVQVVEGRPHQVFTNDELKCYNLYPVPDVEWGGFPVTPIDTVITAITTHINITTHNKMYFQSGRATRGMLVIKSDDVTQEVLSKIKQNFNASINSSQNSFRMPVFGIGTESEIAWQPLDPGGGRDMEFQYLTDMNAREILTAFMMSPDELPGWSYLSKGTNSQALSESSKEYQLTAARDVGIRPLLAAIEDFVNAELFPLIDPDLAKKARFSFKGLDAETPEQENERIAAAQSLWMSYNDILQIVEKPTIPTELGGNFPLNPVFRQVLDAYLTVGEILEKFFGVEGASKDPKLDYRRDQFWFQQVQLQLQQQQLQMAAQQSAQQPQGPDGGPPSPDGGGSPTPSPNRHDEGYIKNGQAMGNQNSKAQAQSDGAKQDQLSQVTDKPDTSDMGKALLGAYDEFSKSELALPPAKRKLITQHEKTVSMLINGFQRDSSEALDEILGIAKKFSKKK